MKKALHEQGRIKDYTIHHSYVSVRKQKECAREAGSTTFVALEKRKVQRNIQTFHVVRASCV